MFSLVFWLICLLLYTVKPCNISFCFVLFLFLLCSHCPMSVDFPGRQIPLHFQLFDLILLSNFYFFLSKQIVFVFPMLICNPFHKVLQLISHIVHCCSENKSTRVENLNLTLYIRSILKLFYCSWNIVVNLLQFKPITNLQLEVNPTFFLWMRPFLTNPVPEVASQL